jgi:hypothetical protein
LTVVLERLTAAIQPGTAVPDACDRLAAALDHLSAASKPETGVPNAPDLRDPSGPIPPLADVARKSLELRLEAARAAQERTRLAFFVVTIISLAMVTAGWNAYLSFYRDAAYEFRDLPQEHTDASGKLHNEQGVRTLQREVLSAWVRSRMVNIALLGISVGTDDATTLGAAALLVALVWFYLAVRRENYSLGWLLMNYNRAPLPLRWLVYHGINSYSVFTNVRHADNPITSIDQVPRDEPVRFLRGVTAHLYKLPFYALVLLLVLEIASLVRTSPFRPPFDQSAMGVLPAFDQTVMGILIHKGEWYEILSVLFWRLVALALLIPVYRLCRRIDTFAKATEKNLATFLDRLEDDTTAAKAAAAPPVAAG